MGFKSAFSFSSTAAIQYRLAKHKKILGIVLSVSPAQIQPHIKDCVINHDKLLIYVSSAAWASQLRFFHTQIKKAVNQQSGEKIATIRIRIVVPSPLKTVNREKKSIPSVENVEMLRNNADALPEGNLRKALLKLSHTLEKI